MRDFAVEKRVVCSVSDHENADTLSICNIEGVSYNFISKKGDISPGIHVIWFPEDSIIPDGILDLVDLNGKLSGKDKNRVKAVKLRGVISQGLLIRASLVEEFIGKSLPFSQDLCEILGVKKYEPVVKFTTTGNLHPLPSGVPKYKVFNAENCQDVVSFLLDSGIDVFITEKLEGTNISVTYDPTLDTVCVNTHSCSIEELPHETKENTYCKFAKHYDWVTKVKEVYEILSGGCNKVTIFGEMIGPNIQKNVYGLPNIVLSAYDILLTHQDSQNQFVDAKDKFDIFNDVGIAHVPLLFHGKLQEYIDNQKVSSLVEASFRKSTISEDIPCMEGIIITPECEISNESIGRVILKQKSPEYLVWF
jgi:RNA ligase (TIGR02306 family)